MDGLRSAQNVALAAGPLVVLAFVLGGVPVYYVLARRRLPRDLSGLMTEPATRRTDLFSLTGAIQGVAAIAVAEVAQAVMRRLSPGASAARIDAAIAAFSTQILSAWESVALWCGAAFTAGTMAPVWLGLHGGGTGFAPALALGFWFAPLATATGSTAYIAVLALTDRDDLSQAAGYVGAAAVAWAGWVFDWRNYLWGLTSGPELTLWVVAMAAMCAARNLRPAGP